MILHQTVATRLKSLSIFALVSLSGISSAQGVYTLSNTSLIHINAADGSEFTTTDLYPSSITFANIPSGETISSLTITLNGLTLTDTNAVMAAVAKKGTTQSALLFDGPGDVGNSVTGLNLTFDEDAVNSLPTSGSFGTGIYKPDFANTGYNDVLPIGKTANPSDPAPQVAAQDYASGFSAFQGQNPNGIYQLFLNDFYPDSSGSLTAGWSITIKTSVPAPSSLAGVGIGGAFMFCFAASSRKRKVA